MSLPNNSDLEHLQRVVVKVGSNVLTSSNGLNIKIVNSITRQICRLLEKGLEVILVSSGAMAAGLKKVGLSQRPDLIASRQAIAAVGQAGLINEYEKSFSRYNIKVAQILLTSEDLDNRERYLNARNTINTLLSWQIIPIINENDTVKTEEIKLGDNDNLAAMITLLMDAGLLINLTDIDGLYNKDPRACSDAKLISRVLVVDDNIEQCACSIPGPLGTGGMLSKIKAAQKVTAAGVPMIIAGGARENILDQIIFGQEQTPGTYFMPGKEKLASRKCWIAYTLKPKGELIIDKGAADALLKRGKSLLPSGITEICGNFGIGAPVAMKERNSKILGVGLVNYSADEIRKISGLKSSQIKKRLGEKPYDEVIHRDNMVITAK